MKTIYCRFWLAAILVLGLAPSSPGATSESNPALQLMVQAKSIYLIDDGDMDWGFWGLDINNKGDIHFMVRGQMGLSRPVVFASEELGCPEVKVDAGEETTIWYPMIVGEWGYNRTECCPYPNLELALKTYDSDWPWWGEIADILWTYFGFRSMVDFLECRWEDLINTAGAAKCSAEEVLAVIDDLFDLSEHSSSETGSFAGSNRPFLGADTVLGTWCFWGCMLSESNPAAIDKSLVPLTKSNGDENGFVRLYWYVEYTGHCVLITSEDPPGEEGSVAAMTYSQANGTQFKASVAFDNPLAFYPDTSGKVLQLILLFDTDDNPYTGCPYGQETGAEYRVDLHWRTDDTIAADSLMRRSWVNNSHLCHPVLHAHFNKEDPESAPIVDLPGYPLGDVISYASPSVMVRSAVGNLLSQPVRLHKDMGPGSAKLMPTASSAEECDSALVSWYSVAAMPYDTNSASLSCAILGDDIELIGELEYTKAGGLAFNDIPLGITWVPDQAQHFQFVLNFGTQTIRVEVDGAPLPGFQAVPFEESAASFEHIQFLVTEACEQTYGVDEIYACVWGHGSWGPAVPDPSPIVMSPDSTFQYLDGLGVTLRTEDFGLAVDSQVCVRVISVLDDRVIDILPEPDDTLHAPLLFTPDVLSPAVTNYRKLYDAGHNVTGLAVDFSEPVDVDSTAISIEPPVDIELWVEEDNLKTLYIQPVSGHFGPGVWTLTIDSMLSDFSGNLMDSDRDGVSDEFRVDIPIVDYALDSTFYPTDSTFSRKGRFSMGDPVCVLGNGLSPGVVVHIYLVPHDSLVDGQPLIDWSTDGWDIDTSTAGKKIWGRLGKATVPCEYNIVADLNLNGIFESGFDLVTYPGTYQVHGNYSLSVECCAHNRIRGDVNLDGTGPDIADLVYLIDYMFVGGAEPLCFEESDVNGDEGDTLDISDLNYLIEYMFLGGPEPVPCH